MGIIHGVWANGVFFVPTGAMAMGKMPVKTINGRHGLLREDGTTVGEVKYDAVAWFNDDCVAVVQGESYLLLDKNGEELEELFDDVYELYGPWAAGKKGDRWYFVDVSQKKIIKNGYTNISQYTCGYALIQDKSGYGAIDMDGSIVIPPMHEEVFYLGEDKFGIKENGFYAMADKHGVIGDFDYTYLGRFYKGMAKAEKEGQSGYINTKGEWC